MWQTRKPQQAPLSGRGLNEESKTVSSAAVETEDMDSKEDQELIETGTATKFRSLAVTLNCMSMDKSGVQNSAKVRTKVGTHTRKLANIGEGWKILCRSVEGNVGGAKLGRRLQDCSDGVTGPERKSTSGGMMMISGGSRLAEDPFVACFERGRVGVLRHCNGDS